MKIETDRLLAWVSPCGGLLDFSVLDGDAPRPLLRRAVPSPARPAWLALEVRFDDVDTHNGVRLLDRTPVSARLALGRGGAPGGGALVIRYELNESGLAIETAGVVAGTLRLRLDGSSPRPTIESAGSTRGPTSSGPTCTGPADTGPGELIWNLAEPVSLFVGDGPCS